MVTAFDALVYWQSTGRGIDFGAAISRMDADQIVALARRIAGEAHPTTIGQAEDWLRANADLFQPFPAKQAEVMAAPEGPTTPPEAPGAPEAPAAVSEPAPALAEGPVASYVAQMSEYVGEEPAYAGPPISPVPLGTHQKRLGRIKERAAQAHQDTHAAYMAIKVQAPAQERGPQGVAPRREHPRHGRPVRHRVRPEPPARHRPRSVL